MSDLNKAIKSAFTDRDDIGEIIIRPFGDTYPSYQVVLRPQLRGTKYPDVGMGEGPTIVDALIDALAESEASA